VMLLKLPIILQQRELPSAMVTDCIFVAQAMMFCPKYWLSVEMAEQYVALMGVHKTFLGPSWREERCCGLCVVITPTVSLLRHS